MSNFTVTSEMVMRLCWECKWPRRVKVWTAHHEDGRKVETYSRLCTICKLKQKANHAYLEYGRLMAKVTALKQKRLIESDKAEARRRAKKEKTDASERE